MHNNLSNIAAVEKADLSRYDVRQIHQKQESTLKIITNTREISSETRNTNLVRYFIWEQIWIKDREGLQELLWNILSKKKKNPEIVAYM